MSNLESRFKKFKDWVNADEGLPTLEELGHGHDDVDEHDAHGHDEHGHDEHDEHGHDEHGHDEHVEHGHDEHGHDEHVEHGHDEHAHDEHVEHRHDEHAHDAHGHDEQPEPEHGHDKHDAGHAAPVEADVSEKPAAAVQPGDELKDSDAAAYEEEEKDADFLVTSQVDTMHMSKKQKAQVELLNLFFLTASTLLALGIIGLLLMTVSDLPRFGSADNPAANEVYTRYVEKGMEETGAKNIVAAMILDYRAFDTLGEAIVLFTAIMGVVMLIRTPDGTSVNARGRKEREDNA